MSRVLRVQDHKGRGPWRPGFSETWVDAWRTSHLPPIYQELPAFVALVNNAHRDGFHIGCAARGTEGLMAWFSPMELLRLSNRGFKVVDATGCEIIAETPHQIIIGSRKPLYMLPSAALEATP